MAQPERVEVERLAEKLRLKFPALSFAQRKKVAVVLLSEKDGVANHENKTAQ